MKFQPVLSWLARKTTPFAFGVCLTFLLLTLGFGNFENINDFGNKKSLDLLSQTFPYEHFYPENAPGLVLVAIDDESMKQLGQWPWPRQTIAKIIENAKRSNVAAIGLDILFLEQDRYSPLKMSTDLHLPVAKLESLGIVDGDAKLGGVLKQAPSVLAFALGRRTEKHLDANLQKQLANMPNRFIAANDADQNLLSVPSVVFPQRSINQSPGLGFVNALEEGGLIREVPLVASYGDHLLPSLSLEMLRVAQGANNYIIKPSESGHALQIKVGGVVVQANPHGQLLFHQGHVTRFPQVTAYQLSQGPVSGLDGRLAVFGVNALALGDQHATSLEDSVPGAYMHLQALDQMLAGRFITMHPGLDRMIFLACALIACVVCYLVVHVPLIYALGIVALSFSALIGISAYCFIQLGFVFNIFVSSAILLLGGVGTYLMQSIHEERLRKKMQSSFAQYVPADVVKRISKSQQAPKLGGELIQASVLFLDLRGFTSLTESLKPYPELMVQVIGAIMDEVTARLIESGATIDKYIGDAVMAFWNAPERQSDHLVRALYGACRIQEDLEIIRGKIHQMDPIVQEAKIAFGIGICCGPITVGNFGSSFRFNYTVLGDAVNTASRLESLTKEKGAPILVAADELKDRQYIEFANRVMLVSLVGSTEIRGKQEVLNIFTAKFIK
jgi:adenylate cyclase